MIGGTMSATFPDRVGCAVLLNGTASEGPRWDRLQLALAARMTRLAARPLFVRSTVVPRFLGKTTRRRRPDLVAGLVTMIKRNDARSASFAVESIVVRRPDQHALFGHIAVPTLVVAGREDASFPVAEVRPRSPSASRTSMYALALSAKVKALRSGSLRPCPGGSTAIVVYRAERCAT